HEQLDVDHPRGAVPLGPREIDLENLARVGSECDAAGVRLLSQESAPLCVRELYRRRPLERDVRGLEPGALARRLHTGRLAEATLRAGVDARQRLAVPAVS